MHLHELDILNPISVSNQSRSGSSENIASAAQQIAHVEILSIAIAFNKSCLESFLKIPSAEYHNISFIEWQRFTTSVVCLYRLSLGLPNVPAWNVHAARDIAKLEYYLEAAYIKTEIIDSIDSSVSETAVLFSMLRPILKNTLSTYLCLKELSATHTIDPEPPLHGAPGSISAHHHKMPIEREAACPAMRYFALQTPEPSPPDILDEGFSLLEESEENMPMGMDNDFQLWDDISAQARFTFE
jgi:hypothetical protein